MAVYHRADKDRGCRSADRPLHRSCLRRPSKNSAWHLDTSNSIPPTAPYNFKESVQFVHPVGIPRQGTGEIETKTIDVHFEHPVPQAIHDQLERARMQKIEGVTSTGEIEIETRIFRL